jgi:hypothetical protein
MFVNNVYLYRQKIFIFIKRVIFIQNKQQYLVKIENTTQFIHVYLIFNVCVYVHETTIEQKEKLIVEYNK